MDWSLPHEYWRTSWKRWTPDGAGLMLFAVVGTATHHDIDGTLQQVLDTICGEEKAELPHCGMLSDPLRWKDPKDPDSDAENEEAERRFAELLTRAGRPVPTTNQEFADLLVDLGVLIHTSDPERWRVALPMPKVSDVLPLSDEEKAIEEDLRESFDYRAAEQSLLRWTKEHVPGEEDTEEAPATLRQLANDCELGEEQTRRGLAVLSKASDITVLRHNEVLERGQILQLQLHQRFQIRMDWVAHSEDRITIMRGGHSEEEVEPV